MSSSTLVSPLPVALDGSTTHNDSRPVRMVIRNFPRYAKLLNTLPIEENIKLVIVADFIAESYSPGFLPIVEVRLIGHADRDFQTRTEVRAGNQ
jgi:hypothetical protein